MLIDALATRSHELDNLLTLANASIENAPEGKLRISSTKSNIQFFLRSDETGPNGRYIPKNHRLVCELSQKEYAEKVLFLATKQKKAIDRLLDDKSWGLLEHQIKNVPSTMHPQKQSHIDPFELSEDAYAQVWAEQEFEPKPFPYGAPTLLTEKGERVRSKSEIIIANTLHRQGIPYHYEKPIALPGEHTIHPDFTVLNKRTRQEYLWEHLGMMDDLEYSNRALQRLERYYAAKYLPGVNLIITHETSSRPLDTKVLQHVVDAYLA